MSPRIIAVSEADTAYVFFDSFWECPSNVSSAGEKGREVRGVLTGCLHNSKNQSKASEQEDPGSLTELLVKSKEHQGAP